MRRAAKAVVVVGVALGAVALGATAAHAHALVKSSQPSNGQTLSSPPARVTILFTEPPDPKLSTIQVLDSSGTNVARAAQPVASNPSELVAPLPSSLPDGVYTVSWRTVSKVDGHVTSGTFTFGVGKSVHAAASSASRTVTPASVSVIDTAGRWLFYWGIALLFAAPIITVVVFGAREPAVPPLLWGCVGLSVAGWVLMVVWERTAAGVGLGQLISTSTGRDLVYQGAGLLVCAGAVAAASLRRGRLPLVALTLAAAVTIYLHAQAGHAAATHPVPLNVAAQVIHLLAVALWIGGLVWLLIGLRTAGARAAAVGRFSIMAGICIVTVAVTGAFRAYEQIGGLSHLSALVGTGYGWSLVAKSALFVPLAALGALNRYRNVGAVGRRMTSFFRTAGGEVVLGAAILVATAVLTQLAPPIDLQAGSAGPSGITATGHDYGLTTKVALSAQPGRVGTNSFRARITRYGSDSPVPAQRVQMTFSLPGQPQLSGSTLGLRRSRPGVWSGSGTALAAPGRWHIQVLVQSDEGAAVVPLRLRVPRPPQQIQVSRAPGQPTIFTIEMPDGSKLQSYVDPGRPGTDNVHFTFFTPQGKELPIASARAKATSPSGHTSELQLRRFSKGHFIATRELTSGRWAFEIDARTRAGTTESGHFSERI